MNSIEIKKLAIEYDAADELKNFRDLFLIPEKNGKKVIYLCGNSLGLQAKSTKEYLMQELNDWAEMGVEGHFNAKNPWFSYHEKLIPQMAKIIGAKNDEVAIMDTLTTNLHLMMVSFYRPNTTKYKILCEEKSFPSDSYVLESQIKFHKHLPDDAIIRVQPEMGEYHISNEKFIESIEKHKDELALILLGGVNYYSGQVFDMKKIAMFANKYGITIGYDLAHAVGNTELHLHDWNVDFACWCNYKYMNAGPGAVGGLFVHEKHAESFDIPRFAGWFGNDPKTRFLMENTFHPAKGAMGWQLSNEPILSMAALKASLDIFDSAGIEKIHAKREKLSAFLFTNLLQLTQKLKTENHIHCKIITPSSKNEFGCQVSLLCENFNGKELFSYMLSQGIIADWREPGVIRLAAVPLYNSFMDVYNLILAFNTFFENQKK